MTTITKEQNQSVITHGVFTYLIIAMLFEFFKFTPIFIMYKLALVIIFIACVYLYKRSSEKNKLLLYGMRWYVFVANMLSLLIGFSLASGLKNEYSVFIIIIYLVIIVIDVLIVIRWNNIQEMKYSIEVRSEKNKKIVRIISLVGILFSLYSLGSRVLGIPAPPYSIGIFLVLILVAVSGMFIALAGVISVSNKQLKEKTKGGATNDNSQN